ARREYQPVTRAQLRGAIKEYNGWRFQEKIPRYELGVVHTSGRPQPLYLDEPTERYWWSTTFVPPGPGHPRATGAVGSENGGLIFALESGRRPRVFAGHFGPVVSVVPSPDGRWLASSSTDQTIMLYPLAGSDTRPVLGASFRRRPDGHWEVSGVQPRSFA